MLKDLRNAPMPVAIVVLGYLGPQELSLFLGSMRLPIHRLALLLMFCVAATVFLRRRVIKLHGFDYAFLAFNLWTVFAYVIHMGAGDGIEYGGSLALESFASYFVARIFIRDEKSFRGALAFIFAAILIAGAVALPETLFGRHYVHEALFSSLAGIAIRANNRGTARDENRLPGRNRLPYGVYRSKLPGFAGRDV